MSSTDVRISFICRNYRCTYETGRLRLPLSFYYQYGSQLPEQVYLHVPSRAIWSGKISKDKKFINGLEEMMSFHNVKPYHVVILEYRGGCNFKMEIFNPCCVEIDYDLNHNIQFSTSTKLEANTDLVYFDDLEAAKLFECYRHNAYYNFSGLYNLRIEQNHFNEACNAKLLPGDAILKLNLNESVECIEVGFKQFKWAINLKWLNGEAYLEKGWIEFLKECRIAAGDWVVFSKKLSSNSFRVVFFSENLGATSSANSGTNPKFCKLMKRSTIENGEMEIPFVFMEKYGQNLTRSIVEVDLGGGHVSNFKFCSSTHTLFGLSRFMTKYKIRCNYMFFFTYMGGSKFSLRVYDSLCFDHLHDDEGALILDEFVIPIDGPYYICLSTISGTLLEDDNEEEAEVNSYSPRIQNVIEVDDEPDDRLNPPSCIVPIEIEDDDVSDIAMNVIPNDNEDHDTELDANEERRFFHVILKKSHLNHRCRGVYIPSSLIHDYHSWGSRTTVQLSYGPLTWSVQVICYQNTYRFGIGWDQFVSDNSLVEGNELCFTFVGNFRLEARLVM